MVTETSVGVVGLVEGFVKGFVEVLWFVISISIFVEIPLEGGFLGIVCGGFLLILIF